MDKTVKNVALGAIGGASLDLLVDIPVDAVLGYVPAIFFHEGLDPTQPQVYSFRLGDVITTAIGGLMAWKGKNTVKEVGYGILAGVGAVKAVELMVYIASKAGVNYQEVSPIPLAKAGLNTDRKATEVSARSIPQNSSSILLV